MHVERIYYTLTAEDREEWISAIQTVVDALRVGTGDLVRMTRPVIRHIKLDNQQSWRRSNTIPIIVNQPTSFCHIAPTLIHVLYN